MERPKNPEWGILQIGEFELMKSSILNHWRTLAGALHLAGRILPWIVWAAMTVAMILYVRQFTRNVPYMDDMVLVGIMTGSQPVNVEWLWAQHNEHRPVISKLILAGLYRLVQNDFRMGMFFNVGLLSIGAAMLLLLARSIRGTNGITDSVLPLTILNVGQTESLSIAFAMNLVLTAWISYDLIAMAGKANRRPCWSLTLRFGLCLALLPLAGGSGLVMLPPLVCWLVGYLAWGWWSDRQPGGVARAIGIGLLMACAAIIALYLSRFVTPADLPFAPSVLAAAFTTLECLSLVLCPNIERYWVVAGLLITLLIVATVLRLVRAGLREPRERVRAFGLIAVILAILDIAFAVGLSRSGLGPGPGRANRYITLMTPLLGALYVAWLTYPPVRGRQLLHIGLLVLVGLSFPFNTNHGVRIGERLRRVERRVERDLRDRVPASQLIGRACPTLYPDPVIMYQQFKQLKIARFGPFADLVDDWAAAAPEVPAAVRR